MSPPRLPIALLETLLPPRLAAPVIGDLLEAFAARPSALAFWYEALVALRCADRRKVWPALGASLGFAVGAVASRLLWAWVLYLVPLRAGHAPSWRWTFALLAVQSMLALAGGIAAARLAEGDYR